MKRKSLIKKGILTLSLIPLILCSACGKDNAEVPEEEIVLLDPVSVAQSCVAAEYRDIYDYKVTGAICAPALSECVMETGMTFLGYEKTPGEEVKKGDVLISGDTGDLDKRISDQVKNIANMESNHADDLEQRADNLEKAKKNDWEGQRTLSELLEVQPDEDAPNYDAWMAKHFMEFYGPAMADLNLRRTEEQNKESAELYDLDLARQQQILTELQREKNNKMLLAGREGTVVALGFVDRGNYSDYYRAGDWIRENTISMALGDTSVKQLRCDYINNSDINKANDVYALVDGQRFEVQYEPLSSEEYERLEEKNGKVYGIFSVEDPEGIIDFGDFATIVMENEHKTGVLAVPTDCLLREGDDYYVYLFDGSTYSEQPVVCGISDGQYTEILSGLDAGDMVKAEYKLPGGANEAVLKTGSVHSDFSATGFLYYPSAKPVVNPVQYGTVYLDEICVKQYQQVQAGEVIARVHVVSDPVEIERTEREIQRLNEQIAWYKKEGEKENKYQIKNLNKQIEEKQEYVSKLKNDAATREIRAGYDGVITEISNAEAGEIWAYNSSIGRLADDQSCFVMVEDADGKLTYGTPVEISYQDESGAQKSVECEVATVNLKLLDKSLQSGQAVVKLPLEVAAEIAGSSRNNEGWWSLSRVNVKAQLRNVDNVLLVPKKAVKEVNRTTYVTVIEDNGARRQQAFVSGGADSDNYWVVTGLTEGTKICWE